MLDTFSGHSPGNILFCIQRSNKSQCPFLGSNSHLQKAFRYVILAEFETKMRNYCDFLKRVHADLISLWLGFCKIVT